jgi:hypothetical protein
LNDTSIGAGKEHIHKDDLSPRAFKLDLQATAYTGGDLHTSIIFLLHNITIYAAR